MWKIGITKNVDCDSPAMVQHGVTNDTDIKNPGICRGEHEMDQNTPALSMILHDCSRNARSNNMPLQLHARPGNHLITLTK